MNPTMPLEGLTVVDFSRYLSGPTLTMTLGDLGADVVKIESLPQGDPARTSGPRHESESTYYLASNRNKRSVAVDLRDPRGVDVCTRLVEQADIVVENFRPGVMASIGLDYPEASVLNPQLIYCSISGFGRTGVGASFPGFDQTAQAMSGLMSVTGDSTTGPLRVGIPVADSVTGLVGAIGVLAALHYRQASGRGCEVHTSLIQSMLSLMSYQAQRVLSLGDEPPRVGNDHPIMFPQGTFKTADAPITIAVGNEKMWARFCEVLELPGLADDDRFGSNEKRMTNREVLREIIERRLREYGSERWVEGLIEAGVPAAPVLGVREALNHQFARDLGMVTTTQHSLLGELAVVGRPVSYGDVSNDDWLRQAPPLLGEHSVGVLQEIGLGSEAIDRLIGAGVVVDGAKRAGQPPRSVPGPEAAR